MRIFFLFSILILFTSLIFSQDLEIDRSMSITDSLTYILDDLKDFLLFDEMEKIENLMFSKEPITFQDIFKITGNEIVSKIIETRYLQRKKLFDFNTGILLDSLFSSENKSFLNSTLYFRNFKSFFLIEKDVDERSYIDNYKFGFHYQNLIVGNYRIKTGRNIFSNWNIFGDALSKTFFSNRIELDLSYNEYPSYFGILYFLFFNNLIFVPFVSNIYYDCILDSTQNVSSILTYNIHDDSLSISRKDNLRESGIGFILNSKNEIFNFASFLSDYSKNFNFLDYDKNIIFSFFGKTDNISYDFGISLPNRGYVVSSYFKKSDEEISVSAGLTFNNNFINFHSGYIEKKHFYGFFVNSNFKKLKIENNFQFFNDGDRKTEDDIIFKLSKYFKTTLTFYLPDYNKNSIKQEFYKSLYHTFSIKFTFYLNYNTSNYQKIDFYINTPKLDFNTYIYLFNVVEQDRIWLYEYSFFNTYPIKFYQNQKGLVYGVNFSIKKNIKTDFGIIKNYKDLFSFYLSLKISF